MNENQKQRIAEFLNGIIDSSLPAEQQIMMFSEDEGVEGSGTTQNGTCTNKSVSCANSHNGECDNYDLNCSGTTNFSKCQGLNGAVCARPDSSTTSCGGKV